MPHIFRVHHGWQISFCTPEEIFEQFANKITINIHVKECGEDGWIIRKLQALINRYNAHEHTYFGMGMDVLLTNRMDLAAAWRKEHA